MCLGGIWCSSVCDWNIEMHTNHRKGYLEICACLEHLAHLADDALERGAHEVFRELLRPVCLAVFYGNFDAVQVLALGHGELGWTPEADVVLFKEGLVQKDVRPADIRVEAGALLCW